MAGFGRNGSGSSAKAIASAERHGVWIVLRRQGHLEKDIARRFGVTQQAVSKAILKHVRDLPAGEAELLRHTHAAYLASMYKMAIQLCEKAPDRWLDLSPVRPLHCGSASQRRGPGV
jgi:hypothetical protein